MCLTIHTRKEHVLLIHIGDVIALYLVAVGLIRAGFLLTLIHWCSLLAHGHAVVSIHAQLYLTGVSLSVEQGTVTILLTTQIGTQSEDILRGILVHGCIGRTADYYHGIGTIANHYHEHAQQAGIHQACRDDVHQIPAPAEQKIDKQKYHHSYHTTHPAMTIEGNAQHAHTQQEGYVHAHAAPLTGGLIQSPEDHSHQQTDVDNQTRIEGTVELVDKEQLKPSAHLHDTRYDTIQHGGHQDKTSQKGQRGTFHAGLLALLVIEHKHQSRQAEQVEQVNSYTESRQISYEDEPAVGMRLVGMTLPLEHQPEDNCCEKAAVCIHLALYCTKPERIGEGIYQSTCHGAGLHNDGLSKCAHLAILSHQFAHQITDAPEEEHDAGGTEEGTHDIHHLGHQRRIAHKLGKEIGCEHEERCPRGMTHLQLVSCGDKLRTVPKTGCGLYRAAISKCSYGKGHPPHYGIYRLKILHNKLLCIFYLMLELLGKGTTFCHDESVLCLLIILNDSFITTPMHAEEMPTTPKRPPIVSPAPHGHLSWPNNVPPADSRPPASWPEAGDAARDRAEMPHGEAP